MSSEIETAGKSGSAMYLSRYEDLLVVVHTKYSSRKPTYL